jgi:DNA-binding MarR family transcriptional regulator
MTSSVQDRHHVVNEPVRPARTAAGDAFTDLVLEVAWLGGLFTAAGESLARLGGQTLARWVILDAVEDQPMTVAEIARRRGIARQAVQRVADLLAHEGLAAYAPNPQHRRAKLLRPTPSGQEALRSISVAQKAWADALGATIGEGTLRATAGVISEIRRTLMAQELPGRPTSATERR